RRAPTPAAAFAITMTSPRTSRAPRDTSTPTDFATWSDITPRPTRTCHERDGISQGRAAGLGRRVGALAAGHALGVQPGAGGRALGVTAPARGQPGGA